MKEETIIISKKEYDRLVNEALVLDTLHAYGVNNWEGYSEAMEAIDD
jgi:hypothetical protein